jgi:hypothetical protein
MALFDDTRNVDIPDSLAAMLTPHDLPTTCELASFHANALLRHLAQASVAVGEPNAPYLNEIASCLSHLDAVLGTMTGNR